MSLLIGRRRALLAPSARKRFVQDMTRLAGGDIRLFWAPQPIPAGVTVTYDELGNPITWGTAPAARIAAHGLGYSQSFDGATAGHVGVIADADKFSFGDGSADFPRGFSVFMVGNVTDSAALRVPLAKDDVVTGREWDWRFSATDIQTVFFRDQSVPVNPTRDSDAAISMGAVHSYGWSYLPTGAGATAMNGVTQYEDGAVKASTATNQATYVAQENTAGALGLGGTSNSSNIYLGTISLMILASGFIGAAAQLAMTARARQFYGAF